MSENQEIYKKKCLQGIEDKLGWGDSSQWSNADFQKLSELIYEHTDVLLSASTLKRVWGRVKYHGKFTTTTLDALAAFLGYGNWRSFAVAENVPTKQTSILFKKSDKKKFGVLVLGFFGVVMLLVAIFSFFYKSSEERMSANDIGSTLSPSDFSFRVQTLTHSIPNSVIFTYEASKAPTDNVFIQQSWDPNRRIKVSKNDYKHTSIYYEPGFYTAKLVVDDEVVKEHPLLIPSDGWLATINRSPIPIYLKATEFLQKDGLHITPSMIRDKQINLQFESVFVKYFNVGDFEPVSVDDFSFDAQVRNNFGEGSNICQFSQILLITDGMPIVIPLSIKGCISDLNLMSVDQAISGKHADLSSFGVDFSDWIRVNCKGSAENIQYYVNEELAYELPLISKQTKIVGMAFVFMGAGSVKGVRLQAQGEMIYQAF